MRNNTRINRKPKGELQKKVKKAIIELMFNRPYAAYYHLKNNSGFCHFLNGTINIYSGTNHSGKLIRVI